MVEDPSASAWGASRFIVTPKMAGSAVVVEASGELEESAPASFTQKEKYATLTKLGQPAGQAEKSVTTDVSPPVASTQPPSARMMLKSKEGADREALEAAFKAYAAGSASAAGAVAGMLASAGASTALAVAGAGPGAGAAFASACARLATSCAFSTALSSAICLASADSRSAFASSAAVAVAFAGAGAGATARAGAAGAGTETGVSTLAELLDAPQPMWNSYWMQTAKPARCFLWEIRSLGWRRCATRTYSF